MGESLKNFTDEFRESIAHEADNLAKFTRNLHAMTEDLRSGKGDGNAEAVARVDDPVPTAALLLRVARARREAATAADEFRSALVIAVGRAERSRRAEHGEGEE